MTPEQSLALAVIKRAVDDVRPLKTKKKRVKIPASKDGDTAGNTRRYMREARLFLTDKYGAWAEARRVWCGMAGMDADALREHTVKTLKL